MDLAAPGKEDNESAPLKKAAVGGWKAVRYILGNETFEKLASMSLVANLVVYLHTKYNLDNVVSANVFNVWSGSCNIAPLFGAFLADTYLGKFYTLLIGSIASLLGMGALMLTAGLHSLTPSTCNPETKQCEQPNTWQIAILYLGLGLLVVGSGGLRPCNIAFGADQFDTSTAKGKAQLDSFCNWWYLLFTAALLVALTGVVYVQTTVSWALGFAIPTGCFALSIIIFLLGTRLYVRVKPQGSIFADIVKVIFATCRKCGSNVGQTSGQTLYDPPPTGLESQTMILAHTDKLKVFDKAAMIVDPSELDSIGRSKNDWRLCSVQQVEQLKSVIQILPVWVTGIFCFIGMQQMNSFGIFQAVQMNKSIGSKFQMPPAWMGLIPMIALSVWIIIYESIFVPQMQKRSNDENGGRLRMEKRFKIGIVMSILCMLVAGLTEMKRRESALDHKAFESPISVALLVPQFALSGLIEAFAAIALMEILTVQWPQSMRTFAGAVFFLSLSAASYLTTFIVNIVKHLSALNGNSSWLGGNDLNKNRLDYYYYTIAAMGILNFVYFHFFARHYLFDAVAGRHENPSCSDIIDTEKGL